jgi:hypothetical protein
MLPICDSLKGEKVESFIDYDFPSGALQEFFRQEFTPGMLPEYFAELIKKLDLKDSERYKSFLFGDYRIAFFRKLEFSGWQVFDNDFMTISYTKENPEHKEVIIVEIISPQTLDQFITNCLQAGLKLKWR